MPRIIMTKQALRDMKRLPTHLVQQIEEGIEGLLFGTTRLEHLTGRSERRFRVGEWRVLVDVKGDAFTILRVQPRGSAYKP